MTEQNKKCQNCYEEEASLMSRETKKSEPIFLCKICAFKTKFLRLGIVSYHGNLPWPIQSKEKKKKKGKTVELPQYAISSELDEEIATGNIDEKEIKEASIKHAKKEKSKNVKQRKKKLKEDIPEFKTEDQEAEYWDTHSPLDVLPEAKFEKVITKGFPKGKSKVNVRKKTRRERKNK